MLDVSVVLLTPPRHRIFNGMWLNDAVKRPSYSLTATRPRPTLGRWPVSGGNATITCRSPPCAGQ